MSISAFTFGDTIEKGKASWYGSELKGRTTASGEPFDPEALTAAHRTLPFGTMVIVTRDSTGNSVIVRVNDRGPTRPERIIDVSEAAARKLGLIVDGVADVTVEVQSTSQKSTDAGITKTQSLQPSSSPSPNPTTQPDTKTKYSLQLGAFEDEARANSLKNALMTKYKEVTVTKASVQGKEFWRVRLGEFSDMESVLKVLKSLFKEGFSEVAVVKLGPDETFIKVESP